MINNQTFFYLKMKFTYLYQHHDWFVLFMYLNNFQKRGFTGFYTIEMFEAEWTITNINSVIAANLTLEFLKTGCCRYCKLTVLSSVKRQFHGHPQKGRDYSKRDVTTAKRNLFTQVPFSCSHVIFSCSHVPFSCSHMQQMVIESH